MTIIQPIVFNNFIHFDRKPLLQTGGVEFERLRWLPCIEGVMKDPTSYNMGSWGSGVFGG